MHRFHGGWTWASISPVVEMSLFPPDYLFSGLGNEGYIYEWKAGHMSISLGADRITLLLWVCVGYRTIPPPEYKTRYPCKWYQNVLYLHLSRPRDPISICLSMPATCPQAHPEMRGGDDLTLAVELRITKIHLPKRVHIAEKRLRRGVSAVPPSPSQKVAKGCQIASGNTERWWGEGCGQSFGDGRWQIWSARMFVLNWGGNDWWKCQLLALSIIWGYGEGWNM